ncbi:MAG: hypothetical protein ACR2IH_12000 [Pyrinomonadaceae bacterium]
MENNSGSPKRVGEHRDAAIAPAVDYRALTYVRATNTAAESPGWM